MLHRPLFAALCWALVLPVGIARAETKQVDLRVLPGDWGDASEDDIKAVCRSAAQAVLQHCGERKLEPLSLRQDKSGPMVIYGLGSSGERRILLNVRDAHWAQFAYQFSHEVGHVLCNYREADRDNLWFEESLCEAASLFALRSMAESWKTDPPYSNWKDYATSLQTYADERMTAAARRDKQSFADWYRQHAATLQKDPTNRALNQVVALEILKLLEEKPRHWQALEQLNQWPAKKSLSFTDYLQDWHDRLGEEQRPFVVAIARRFEITLR